MKRLTAAAEARALVKVGGALLTLVYTWLTLTWAPVLDLVRSLPAAFILQLAVILYFIAWFYGTGWDIDAQESAFIEKAVAPHLSAKAFAAAAAVVAMFAALCWLSRRSHPWFALGLLAFWCVNVTTWHVALKPEIERRIADSREALRRAGLHADLVALERTVNYVVGGWQVFRFAAGFALLLGLNVAVWGGWLPSIAERLGVEPDILFSIGVLTFVALTEAWIWYERLHLRAEREVIEDVAERFSLVPLEMGAAAEDAADATTAPT